MMVNVAHPVPCLRVADFALLCSRVLFLRWHLKVLRNVRRGSFPCPSMASGGGLSSGAAEHVGGRDDGGHPAHKHYDSTPGAALFDPSPLLPPMLHPILQVRMLM